MIRTFKLLVLAALLLSGLLMPAGFALAQAVAPYVSVAPFYPTGQATLAVSNSSSSVALPTSASTTPAAATVLITNTGTVDARVVLGGSSVVATTSSYLVPAGQWRAWQIGSQTYLAAITASSTTNLDVATGVGFPAGGSASGGGSGGTSSVNLTQVGGTSVALGANTSANSIPVVMANDATLAVSGSVTASGTLTLGAGSAIAGKVGIDQTTPGTTNGVQVNAALPAGTNVIGHVIVDTAPSTAVTNAGTFPTQPGPSTSGGLSVKRLLVANNTTSVAVDASAGQVYAVEAFNNASTIAYVKLYDASQGSTTCGSGTPKWSEMIPAPASGGGGYLFVPPMGVPFATAITLCVTGGYADNDTTAPAAATYIVNVFYK